MEKPKADLMSRPPRPPKEAFFTRERGTQVLMHGSFLATVNIVGFAYVYISEGTAYAQAAAFYVTTFAQLFFSFTCRSQRYTLSGAWRFFKPVPFRSDRFVGNSEMSLLWFPLTRGIFFKTAPQFGFDWLLVFVLALAPVSMVEIAKLIGSRFRGGKNCVSAPPGLRRYRVRREL